MLGPRAPGFGLTGAGPKGFENDIRRILGLCLPSPASSTAFTFGKANTSRLTAMFSATWPNSVRRLAEDFMCKPVRVNVGSDELAAKTSIEQTVIVLDDGRQKENRLLAALADAGHSRRPSKAVPSSSRDKCLVFALYKKVIELFCMSRLSPRCS